MDMSNTHVFIWILKQRWICTYSLRSCPNIGLNILSSYRCQYPFISIFISSYHSIVIPSHMEWDFKW